MRGINAVVLALGLASAAVWLVPQFVQHNPIGALDYDTRARAGLRLDRNSVFFEVISRSNVERLRYELREDLCRHKGRVRCIGSYCVTTPVPSSVKCAMPKLVAG